ncbi:NAD(P)/FAD-dependent oxidoreductase [Actinokineospora iranica]|uniref:Thioredoxin reductase n=1 Tax=Actinokineospora iranica TaxID=1271860 RepID=A0A1G6M3T4_9PSEU|nr:NAD(P)/FAD-dependent oxidoreductase [Actinokineospora iranica]SDC50163.1 Thioredoxin reductase [Actinokineospora iranica]
MTDSKVFDVVIVGGGPAGLNAALVLGRARRTVAVVDAGEPRNAPATAAHGFLTRDGAPPADLLAIGRAEVAGYGVELIDGAVTSVAPGFRVRVGDRDLRARRLLVTTGLVDELPDLPGVREGWGRYVAHCPYCHGYEVRDQALGVLANVHLALLIRQWSADVVLFANEMPVPADDRRRLAARGVDVVDGRVAAVGPRGVSLADGRVVERAAVFVGPRFVGRSGLLLDLGCAQTPEGWVAVDAVGLTSVPGVYAAGNVVDPFAQVVTAAGAGARAAIAINNDLVTEEVERATVERWPTTSTSWSPGRTASSGSR